MKRMIRCVFSAIVITSSSLLAQEAAPPSKLPPIPPGPLIQLRAPDFAQWTVTIKDADQNPAAGQTDATTTPSKQPPTYGAITTTTKTGKIKLRESIDNLGQTWPTWCIRGDLQITIRPDTKSVIVNSGPPDAKNPSPYCVDYSRTDFPEIPAGVVSLGNYAGIQMAYGSQCLLFKVTGSLPCTAYVNLKTRLPVAVVGDGIAKIYEFHPPPTTELTPSAEVLQVLKNMDLINNSVSTRR